MRHSIFVFAIVFSVLVCAAYGQLSAQVVGEPTAPAAVASSQPLTRDDCLRWSVHANAAADVVHTPSTDVSADANLPSTGGWQPPQQVVIENKVPLTPQAFTSPAPFNTELEAVVGKIVVDLQTGKLTIDGQPLTPEFTTALRTQCQALGVILP